MNAEANMTDVNFDSMVLSDQELDEVSGGIGFFAALAVVALVTIVVIAVTAKPAG